MFKVGFIVGCIFFFKKIVVSALLSFPAERPDGKELNLV